MNFEKYKRIPKKIRQNSHKTQLMLIPLLNVLYEYCRPFHDIKIQLDAGYYNNLSANDIVIKIIYDKEIISIAAIEIYRNSMIYDVVSYKESNISQMTEELKCSIDDINEILELINKKFIQKNLRKKVHRNILNFGITPDRIMQTGQVNTINQFRKNENI